MGVHWGSGPDLKSVSLGLVSLYRAVFGVLPNSNTHPATQQKSTSALNGAIKEEG